jgi:uncharacterized membrane protein YciS (DUF1049 family)
MEGLIGTVIGVNIKDVPFEYVFEMGAYDGVTMIPSLAMALLTSRLVILWLLNVIFLICVPISVCRLPNKKRKVSV